MGDAGKWFWGGFPTAGSKMELGWKIAFALAIFTTSVTPKESAHPGIFVF